MGLGNPKLCTKFQIAEMLKGNLHFGELLQSRATLTFFFWWDFMLGLGKPKLHVGRTGTLECVHMTRKLNISAKCLA